jgi:hypothetical protein
MNKVKYSKTFAFGLAGALAGFAFYYFIGCNNGCALTGNPYVSTGYGLSIGVLLAWPGKKNRSRNK